jgi:hypothetical protein
MFNSLKNMIFEEDPNEVKPAAHAQAAPTFTNGQLAPASPGFTTTPQVSPEFVTAIRKVVLGRNTALTQLLGAADKLTTIIPDPTTRFKAAFATAGNGRSVKQIAEAVDIHISDVDGEELRFKAAIDQKVASEVGTLEQRAQLAAQAIQSAQQQIEQAQQRITELTQQIGRQQGEQAQAQAEANAKRNEIEQASVQFKLAAQHVRHELQSHKTTIMSALG